MAGIVFDKAQVMAAVDAIAEQTMRMDMMWDWPCGVAYYGMCEVSRVTGDDKYIKMVKDRVDEYIGLGLPIWTVNTCSMGHCLLSLYERYGEEKYKEIALSKLDYLCNKAERFGDSVLQHTVSAKNDFPEQCWADTLMMGAYFMLRAGVMFGDAKLVDDALNQYYWHIEYLQDKSTGLWYHGYNNINKDHMSGFYWGRANSWAAYMPYCSSLRSCSTTWGISMRSTIPQISFSPLSAILFRVSKSGMSGVAIWSPLSPKQ